jgi:hypothetical protein
MCHVIPNLGEPHRARRRDRRACERERARLGDDDDRALSVAREPPPSGLEVGRVALHAPPPRVDVRSGRPAPAEERLQPRRADRARRERRARCAHDAARDLAPRDRL